MNGLSLSLKNFVGIWFVLLISYIKVTLRIMISDLLMSIILWKNRRMCWLSFQMLWKQIQMELFWMWGQEFILPLQLLKNNSNLKVSNKYWLTIKELIFTHWESHYCAPFTWLNLLKESLQLRLTEKCRKNMILWEFWEKWYWKVKVRWG